MMINVKITLRCLRSLVCILMCVSLITGCNSDDSEGDPSNSATSNIDGAVELNTPDEESVSDLKALLNGAPDSKTLPDELKADQVFPTQFDLIDLQSSVKSQGSRGVCSIFSTVALMEHLYIKKGAVEPDFSEQFLQWSVKSELGRFKDTYGSNGSANINAIHRFGIVEESVSPYQKYKWTKTQDERCDGEEQPIVCYTNGTPETEILESKRWQLPKSRWVNAKTQNIKAFIHENQTGVVAGMTFFYQSWNHRKSPLPVSSEYKAQGYILYPNEADREESLKKRAGHSILLIGWDDDLEVPVLDKEGEPKLDEEGNPILERGFFLFKNSWGTSGFGTKNPFGAGYGWLSMRYVEEFANVVSARPPAEDLTEKCDDGFDNNFDGQLDCDDLTCEDAPACQVEPEPTPHDFRVEADVGEIIPDRGELSVQLNIEEEGYLSTLAVDVEIDHSFSGDLEIHLTSPQGTQVILHESNSDNGEPGLKLNLQPDTFIGELAQGVWTLTLYDRLAQDEGQLIKWSLSGVVNPILIDDTLHFDRSPHIMIPDYDPMGVTDPLMIDEEGILQSLSLRVHIDHTYRADLLVSLIHPEGDEVILHNRTGRNATGLTLEVSVPDFMARSIKGEWGLKVADLGRGDEGVLKEWSLDMILTPTRSSTEEE